MTQGIWKKTILSDAVLLAADSGTVTIDLPRSNFIGNIMLLVENTNGSTSNIAAAEKIEENITKIEVIANGSFVVKSYRGVECRKLAQFVFGELPPADESQAASGVQHCMFPILFGRYLGDEEYILPASLYSSLQLKITWSFTDSTTAGYTTSETNAKYTITINEFVSTDSKLSKKILVETEIESFTSAASGNKDINLPLGNRYRRIMVRAYEAAIQDGVDITQYELRINNGAQVPMANKWIAQQDENSIKYKTRTRKSVNLMASNNDTYDSKVSRIVAAIGASGTTISNAVFDAIAGDRLTVDMSDLATPTALTTDQAMWAYIEGIGVSHCIMLDFDQSNDGSDLLSTIGLNDLKLRLTQGGADANVRVVTQEVVEPR